MKNDSSHIVQLLLDDEIDVTDVVIQIEDHIIEPILNNLALHFHKIKTVKI